MENTKNQYIEIMESIKVVEHEVNLFKSINNKLENISNAVIEITDSLSAISEENAATTEEVSVSTDVIADSMIDMKENGKVVKRSSQGLYEVITEFRLES